MAINILDKSVFNLIAAGEVVERPASVVKELVENSIDAGATSISIEITGGGIKRIRISDNGCGISPEDLPKAFYPHATSKVATINDLAKIGTLGFRGEALSSIAAVSRINIVSRTANSDFGSMLTVDCGMAGDVEEKGSPLGTYITVEDIFRNIPARAKFLKTPASETYEINNLVSRLILANPNISFKYSADGNIVYQSSGCGIDDAIFAVYGKKATESMIVTHGNMSDIILEGRICKPEFSKPNRTYQTLVINGRYVVNQTVSRAAYDAYASHLMKHMFPFYVLYLTIPLDGVDVNVHPNKLDVRFVKTDVIFKFIYDTLSGTLQKLRSIPLVASGGEESAVRNIEPPREMFQERGKEDFIKFISFKPKNSVISTSEDSIGFFAEIAEKATSEKPSDGQLTNNIDSQDRSDLLETVSPRVVGGLFNTYIILEKRDCIYLIDHHAAHERLLYDKFNAQIDAQSLCIQDLLIPYGFSVNHSEYEFVLNHLTALKEMGFDIEPMGALDFKISSVPAVLSGINLKSFVNNLLSTLTRPVVGKISDIIKDRTAQEACKAAVKAGDTLSGEEINALLAQFESGNHVLLCPHGRPIIVQLTRSEIEKWFKRIV